MASLSYYTVLDVSPESSLAEIKKNYQKMVLKYHPDRPEGDVEMFEMVNEAFFTLSDPEKRKEYDKTFTVNEIGGHEHLKKGFDNFTVNIKKKEINKIKIETPISEKQMSVQEMSEKIRNMELERKQAETEYMPENIFDGNFSTTKFNEVFEHMKEKENNELVKIEGNPMPFNINSHFGSLGEEDDNLRGDNNGTLDEYFGKTTKQPTKKELKEAKKTKLNDPIEMERKIKERIAEHKKIDDELQNKNIKMKSEAEDPTFGGYGISVNIKKQLENAKHLENNEIKIGKLIKFESKKK